MRNRKRVCCGTVYSIEVERGGFFTSDVSQINTTTGSYRVRGDVGSVNTGEIASLRDEHFYLGVISEKRKYSLIEIY